MAPSLKHRLDRLERRIPPESSTDDIQWDLSELSDDELSYLEGIFAAGRALEDEPMAIEICKKARPIAEPVKDRAGEPEKT